MKIDIAQLVAAFGKVGLDVQQFMLTSHPPKPGPVMTCGSIDLNRIVDAINTVLEPELNEDDAALVAAARAKHCNDECEIDDSPMLAHGAGGEGAFVSAWLYMSYPKKEEAND